MLHSPGVDRVRHDTNSGRVPSRLLAPRSSRHRMFIGTLNSRISVAGLMHLDATGKSLNHISGIPYCSHDTPHHSLGQTVPRRVLKFGL